MKPMSGLKKLEPKFRTNVSNNFFITVLILIKIYKYYDHKFMS